MMLLSQRNKLFYCSKAKYQEDLVRGRIKLGENNDKDSQQPTANSQQPTANNIIPKAYRYFLVMSQSILTSLGLPQKS